MKDDLGLPSRHIDPVASAKNRFDFDRLAAASSDPNSANAKRVATGLEESSSERTLAFRGSFSEP